MCPLVITTRTTTSPKRLGTSDPVKVPLMAAGGDGVGDGGGVAKGEADGDGVVKGEADGLAGLLPALGVGGTAATAANWCGAIL